MEISMEVPQKITITTCPAVPLLGIYPKKSKGRYNRDTAYPCLSWHYS
jgi:hypothetical protein